MAIDSRIVAEDRAICLDCDIGSSWHLCNFVAEINDNLWEIRNFAYGKLFWIILWVVEKSIFELL